MQSIKRRCPGAAKSRLFTHRARQVTLAGRPDLQSEVLAPPLGTESDAVGNGCTVQRRQPATSQHTIRQQNRENCWRRLQKRSPTGKLPRQQHSPCLGREFRVSVKCRKRSEPTAGDCGAKPRNSLLSMGLNGGPCWAQPRRAAQRPIVLGGCALIA